MPAQYNLSRGFAVTFGNRRDRFMCGFADTRGGYTDFSAGGGFIHNRLSSDKDLYITVYHPTKEILSLLRKAVSESGFYIWQTPQIARIKKYESYLNEARQLLRAGENSERLKYLVSELEAYYESVKWRKDFENDEAGLLPKNLKRGVLSEDGIYNLLEEYREVSE